MEATKCKNLLRDYSSRYVFEQRRHIRFRELILKQEAD